MREPDARGHVVLFSSSSLAARVTAGVNFLSKLRDFMNMVDIKRDSEVVRMRKEGISSKQICERFGISRSRVGQIISAFQLD